MIPHSREALLDLAMKLALEVAPATTSEYTAANATFIAVLLQLFAQDCEQGADVRWKDIQELKTLFRTNPPDVEFATEMEAFCKREPVSLKLSDLNELHDQGMALLIRLQAFVELHPDAVSETHQAIWRFLENHSARHSYAVMM